MHLALVHAELDAGQSRVVCAARRSLLVEQHDIGMASTRVSPITELKLTFPHSGLAGDGRHVQQSEFGPCVLAPFALFQGG